jgi:hypothetical protein
MGEMHMRHNSPFSIMIALPQMATEHDEDDLRHEDDDDLFEQKGDELLVSRVFCGVRNGDEAVIKATLELADALESMAHAKDEKELRKWTAQASEAAESIESSDKHGDDDHGG